MAESIPVIPKNRVEPSWQAPFLSGSLTRRIVFGVALSSSVVILISMLSHVTLAEFATIGFVPLLLAAALTIATLLVEVVRFRLITVGLAGKPQPDLRGLLAASLGSNFVALSTPATVGGELVRAAWLSGKGVAGGKSLWIGTFESILSVYVGSSLAVISGIFAFSEGAVLLGSAIVTVAGISFVAYTVLIVMATMKRVLTVPLRLFRLARRFLGEERASRLEHTVQEGAQNFSLAVRATFTRGSAGVLAKALALTLVQAALSGAAFWIVLSASGLRIGLIPTALVAFGTSAIAALPVTVGGAGLTELTASTYLASVYGFSSWAAIVVWRVVSFQLVLAISGVFFMVFVHKATGATIFRARAATGVTAAGVAG